MGKAESFFSANEQADIARQVREAEANTSGEIATMLVDQSDSYLEAINLAALVISLLLALTADLLWQLYSSWSVSLLHDLPEVVGQLRVWTVLPLQVLLYFPARLVLRRMSRAILPFVGRRRLEEAVRERAVRAFYEKGLYRTRHETGILIFISLLEHKVWIIADRGINSRIPQQNWQDLASGLARGIKTGEGCRALCATIARCGDLLADHFPRSADDRNELADELIS